MHRSKLYSARKSRLLIILLAMLWLVLAGAVFFSQIARPPSIKIEWETETEFETAGFHIYRSDSEEGEFLKINQRLIPSKADPASGAKYTYVDSEVIPGKTYFYRLEDVEYDNSTEMHDILSGRASSLSWWAILLIIISIGISVVLLFIADRSKNAGPIP